MSLLAHTEASSFLVPCFNCSLYYQRHKADLHFHSWSLFHITFIEVNEKFMEEFPMKTMNEAALNYQRNVEKVKVSTL